MKLKTKIVGLFLTAVFVPFLVIALFTYIDVQNQLEHSAENTINTLANVQKQRTLEILSTYNLELAQNQSRRQLRNDLSSFVSSESEYAYNLLLQDLLDIQQASSHIHYARVLSSSGVVLASTRADERGKDFSSDTFFLQGKDTNTTSVFFKEEGNVYLHLTGPLIVSQKVHAVLDIAIDTKDLFSLFRDYTGLGTTGSWGLAQREPNGDALFIVPGRFDTDPDSPLHSVLKNTPQNQETPVMHALAGKEEVYPDLVNYLGRHVIAATRYIPGLGWGISVTEERGEVLAGANTLISQLLFFLLLLLIFVGFLGSFVSQVLTSPLHSLTRAAHAVAKGDLSVSSNITSQDELGLLSKTFDGMLRELRSSRDELQHRVEEKTQELEQSRRELRDYLDHMSTFNAKLDTSARILLANSAAAAASGLARDKLIGADFLSGPWFAFDPLVRKRAQEAFAKAASGQQVHYDEQIQLGTGEVIWIDFSLSPVFSPEGKVEYIVAEGRDITREKIIEESKTEFVSIASHQLRTPTTAIRWYAEMLLSEETLGKLDPLQRKYLHEIYTSDRRMIDLINSLLNVSRIELGTLTPQPRPFNLKALIEEIRQEIMPDIEKKNLHVLFENQGDEEIESDPHLLRMILQNLLSNAVTYTPHAGTVICRTRVEPETVYITVEDTGCGIPREVQKNIFTKFFRADNARTIQSDGNGLGLYIVRSIVETLHGSVTFTSIENKGTTFVIMLPRKST